MKERVSRYRDKPRCFVFFSLKIIVQDGLRTRKNRIRKALGTPKQLPSYIGVSLIQAQLQTDALSLHSPVPCGDTTSFRIYKTSGWGSPPPKPKSLHHNVVRGCPPPMSYNLLPHNRSLPKTYMKQNSRLAVWHGGASTIKHKRILAGFHGPAKQGSRLARNFETLGPKCCRANYQECEVSLGSAQ